MTRGSSSLTAAMRLLVIALLSCLLSAACTNSRRPPLPTDSGPPTADAGGDAAIDAGPPGPLFIDFLYQVRCDDVGGCTDLPLRNINNIDGEADFSLLCAVTEVDGQRNLTFSADNNGDDPFFVQIRDARYPIGGGPVAGSTCRVTLQERELTYAGACSGEPPSPTAPCQVSMIAEDSSPDGPTITGSLFCRGLPASADMSILREVTAGGTDPSARTMAAPFRIVNCR